MMFNVVFYACADEMHENFYEKEHLKEICSNEEQKERIADYNRYYSSDRILWLHDSGRTGRHAHKGSAQNIRLGLDLAGGVSITYEAVKDTPTDTEMKDTIQKMQQRAEVYSTESSVVQQGDKRIEVDIPGVADAEEVLKSLGKEGSLDFVSEDDVTVEKDGTVTYDKSQVICSGSEVKNAEANTIQDETTKNKENVVDITFNKKEQRSSVQQPRKPHHPRRKSISFMMEKSFRLRLFRARS